MNVLGSRNYEAPASTLVLLSELPDLDVGSKVRFRGCVSSYSHQTGTLYLTSSHPSPPTTAVDIALVRESVKGPAIMTGAYVNVIGYLTSATPGSRKATDSNFEVNSIGTPTTPITPGLFSPTTSYFEPQATSSTRASIRAQDSMQGPQGVGWNTSTFDFGSRTQRTRKDLGTDNGVLGRSKSFSTRTPSTYLLHRQASNISLPPTEVRDMPLGGPLGRQRSTDTPRAHQRSSSHIYAPSTLSFSQLAEQNYHDRASIASHATNASVATSRRGAVGQRNVNQNEEEFVIARIQAVVLFSVDAVGEGGKKISESFETGVKARRWGMGLMKEARERYGAGPGKVGTTDDAG